MCCSSTSFDTFPQLKSFSTSSCKLWSSHGPIRAYPSGPMKCTAQSLLAMLTRTRFIVQLSSLSSTNRRTL